jgi:outer membrane protein OmpA-like peptidoglycan-associated protein
MVFARTEERLREAREARADFLSPGHFASGKKELDEARKLFDQGGSLKDIERRLERADEELAKAMETLPVARLTLSGALDARDAAVRAEAPVHAGELFAEGDKLFRDAGARVEKGKVKDAQIKAADAERRFRQAEVIAIKTVVIGPARELLAQADQEKADEWAPASLGDARSHLEAAERRLDQDRYDRNEAVKLARTAESEARRGLAIARAARAAAEDRGAYESLLLDAEAQIRAIAESLGYDAPDFGGGLAGPVPEIVGAIEVLKSESDSLGRELAQARAKLEEVRAKERGLTAELAIAREREERVRRVSDLFSSDEAVVIRQGSRLTLRLKGIVFPPAKSALLPENYPLLSRVMRAIRELPGASITIEGHTDSTGDERQNLVLSQERADAVRAYLEANMDLSDRLVSTSGYGETAPIASNKTEEGRALNRRIDIVFDAASLLGE